MHNIFFVIQSYDICIYIRGGMYWYRTVTVQTSRFGAWGLTANTVNSPPIQKGGACSNATLFDNRQHQHKNSECRELRTWKQIPLDSDHVMILNASLTWTDKSTFLAQGLHLKSHQRCSAGIRTWLSADTGTFLSHWLNHHCSLILALYTEALSC